ncbi:Phosphoglycerate mutase [Hymenobacter roseosalivarius DSM 11622]|uniref:Phosphoglycerate mutase n=1 Tax=Hymenobacter roseosalivarius DSM 11622 TaxID=645990 RepID=A0A1W1VX81_9BACT|nr:histidine phosphatase family protein [Hymenobacter roseosalivarius]SMB97977.1 Phosphoglycerate mutase [Hymenobacter roseosalivarius DSM 11622]
MSVKKIYLIRHGQTDFNVQGIVQGSGVDSSLNAAGHDQASRFFAAYKHLTFDKVYTSTLQRTQQSVQGFLDLGLPHEAHSSLNEISWGVREGTRITPEEDAEYQGVLHQWEQGETHARLSGGESPDEVAARQRVFIKLMLSRPEEENILVCMHGRAMRVLLCQLLNYSLSCMDAFEHRNLCLYKVHYTGSMFSVRNFLDTTHLS